MLSFSWLHQRLTHHPVRVDLLMLLFIHGILTQMNWRHHYWLMIFLDRVFQTLTMHFWLWVRFLSLVMKRWGWSFLRGVGIWNAIWHLNSFGTCGKIIKLQEKDKIKSSQWPWQSWNYWQMTSRLISSQLFLPFGLLCTTCRLKHWGKLNSKNLLNLKSHR